ncbi:MAG: hypothetical protein M1818_004225 [Claussenomyces sp. TS43310]|nr:MAG: hypothetical protein M1818_004225 [Claussenomyces sp. TS43310]
MASPAVISPQEPTDADTDYGSGFSSDEEELTNLLSQADNKLPSIDLPDIEDNPIVNDVEYHDPPQTLRIPRVLGRERWSPSGEQIAKEAIHHAMQFPILPVNPGYPDLSHVLSASAGEEKPAAEPGKSEIDDTDTRSPLERFRARPKKALSVTDLVSPAWCELQYYYTMKYHGRKKRTPAMKRGTAVHRELEDQIYTTVKVDIESKEDAWGLRIWNVIQGLRTLQETGHTRELEIWGVVHGQVVNGVIDEVSYACPDPELEAELEKRSSSTEGGLPMDQTTLTDFFNASRGTSTARAPSGKGSRKRRIYLCDVKTRGAPSLPSNAAMRSTKYQLMLYHHILSNLVRDKVDLTIVAARYNFNIGTPFSDSFIAQIGNLNDEVKSTRPNAFDSSALPVSSQDPMAMLLAHNSLLQLWTLMISTLQGLLPDGAASLGRVLKVEYRSSSTAEIIGTRTFPMDEAMLQRYVELEMQWWKGERAPVGVVVEEAYKCRSCDFADMCEWRLQKVQDAVITSRRNGGRLPSRSQRKAGDALEETSIV